MKRFITGVIFIILGFISSIILISIAALNPFAINGRQGLFISLQGNDIFFSFL